MKKNLAIIGASYLQLPLIEKAKSMGYTTHVFAWAAHDVGESAADFFYPISITEKDAILEKCRQIGICGICSIASDLAMITVNYVAHNLNLTGNPMSSVFKCTNKHQMRLAFAKNGDPSPQSYIVNDATVLEDLDLSLPIIVKPTDRSGSRGIYKLDSFEGLQDAVTKAIGQSFEKKALVEEFVEGQEYSVEYVSFHGHHTFLAMTQKQTTGAPHFIETGHLEPAPVSSELLSQVKAIIEHALDTLEITNGASHSEIKIQDNSLIQIIEIGARMGGDCIGSDLVELSTGIDFVRMVIQIACGDAPDFTKVCEPHPTSVRFILTQDDWDAFQSFKNESPHKLVRVVSLQPENIGRVSDSSNRAGCYIHYL